MDMYTYKRRMNSFSPFIPLSFYIYKGIHLSSLISKDRSSRPYILGSLLMDVIQRPVLSLSFLAAFIFFIIVCVAASMKLRVNACGILLRS